MAQDVRNIQTAISQTQLAWLTLSQVPNLGGKTIKTLLSLNQLSVSELINLAAETLATLGLNAKQVSAIKSPKPCFQEKVLNWLQQDKANFVLSLDDKTYPTQLQQITSPPVVLFGKGDHQQLAMHQIAIVGSRNPTLEGKRNARQLAHDLALSGWRITSGLAIGIDGNAHRGALNAAGKTIAVLGSAIDNIYPKRHSDLAQEIIHNQGVILSEFPPGTPTKPENFPRRNRIVSGLSKGTVIIEAAIKSGSLITARYALEQNREVFAMPGNINNPLTKGGHFLIKQGAKLVEDEKDINEEFQNLSFLQGAEDIKNLQKKSLQSLATAPLLDSVGFNVTALDVVAKRSKMPINEVLAQLLEYELRGLVAAVPGGYIKLGGK